MKKASPKSWGKAKKVFKPDIRQKGLINKMQIIMELNQKYQKGYQVRVIMGPVDKTYDKEPLNLNEAALCATTALDALNAEFKTNYKPEEVFRITDEALEINRKIDLASARMYKDIRSGAYELSRPAPPPDIRKGEDGEYWFSARGVLLYAYITWQEEKTAPAKEFMTRYCQLLASRGYGKGATKIFREMEKMGKDDGCEWVRQTYAKYVQSDEEVMEIFQ